MAEWNKHELIEFFGVLPEEDEDQTYLSFNVEKDGLRLYVSFFQHVPAVYIDMFRDGIEEPVFRTRIENSAGMKYMKHANGWECLEVAAPHRNVPFEEERVIPMDARIRVNPHIGVEMFQPSGG
jgi:hypothetical protein